MTTAKKFQIVPEYHATELGAPFDVVLLGSVKQMVDDKTGEVEQVIIPNLRGLIKCIAITRILVPRKLSGTEIKFVRKAFKLSAKRVAEMVDISPEHLSRCEANERLLSPSAEKCLRVSVFLEQFRMLDNLDAIGEGNQELLEKLQKVKEAIGKIGLIIGEMKIAPTFDPEPLTLKFEVVAPLEDDLFQDDPNADWSSNDQSMDIAA